MSIVITNTGVLDETTGKHAYTVRINQHEPLARFNHRREDGLAACLVAAAAAVSAAEYERIAAMLIGDDRG